MKRTSITILILLFTILLSGGCDSKIEKPASPGINWEEEDDGEDIGDSDDNETISSSGTIRPWKEGYLDIHFINTGTGECSFIIMPDGTQMLVDMASTNSSDVIWHKPDNTRKPDVWISRYLNRCMEWTGNKGLDYVVLTHWHSDHVGSYSSSRPSTKGDYKLNGVTYILDQFNVKKVIDRGYPDYDYPLSLKTSNSIVKNYVSCITWHSENNGLAVEQFVPSSKDQIKPTRNPGACGNFTIRNISCNGMFWDGHDPGKVTMIFPGKDEIQGTGEQAEKCPSENSVSIVFKLSYGDFDYYAGGDASNNGETYFEWKNTEDHIADAVGQVEVMKANHHGSWDANSDNFLRVLNPQAIVVNTWNDLQPRAETMSRFLNSTSGDVFITNLDSGQKSTFTQDARNIIKSESGHVVVRVLPEGNSYYIFTLEDDDESMKIIKRTGPYKCR